MEGKRYWFEEVPEEQRYWVVAPWGKPPNRRKAGGEDPGLPGELGAELERSSER